MTNLATDHFAPAQFVGDTVAIVAKEYRPSIRTSYGDKPAYKADVAILDGEAEGLFFEDALIFNKAIVSQLEKAGKTEDRVVIGTLKSVLNRAGDQSYLLVEEPTTAQLRLAAALGF